MTGPDVPDALRAVAARTPGLELLLLHGSRSRGEAHPGSDWDLGYLGEVDPARLLDAVASALGTDRVDLVDLARATALLRFEAARDGICVHESAGAQVVVDTPSRRPARPGGLLPEPAGPRLRRPGSPAGTCDRLRGARRPARLPRSTAGRLSLLSP